MPPLAACVAPVVAPRLFTGAYGTLKERAVAGHLPLDRQGQLKTVLFQQLNLYYDFCCRRNWRVSFTLEFLHVIPQNQVKGDRRFTPCVEIMSSCHKCHGLDIFRLLQQT